MDRSSSHQLKCVVVTPEMAVLDETADFVAIPMYDGELGVLPGRSPLIGRLGIGELRIKNGNNVKRIFIDGGFVQISNDVVTLLTDKAQPAETIDPAAAQRELEAANSKTPHDEIEQASVKRDQDSARAKLRLATK